MEDWFKQSFKSLIGGNSNRRKLDENNGFNVPRVYFRLSLAKRLNVDFATQPFLLNVDELKHLASILKLDEMLPHP
jgi:hypothetical protein